jgi:hypothetical protein
VLHYFILIASFFVTSSKENALNISMIYDVFHKIYAQVNLNNSYNDIYVQHEGEN